MPAGERRCQCLICADYGDRDRLDAIDTDLVANIDERGWGVMMIPEDDTGPGWAYTVGLWHSHFSAEIAMFGLDIYDMTDCLNVLGAQVRDGRALVSDEGRAEVIERYPVVLKDVDEGWRKAFFGTSMGFYRSTREVPFLQVLWPDQDGRLPGVPGCSEGYLALQPSLWLTPDEHPVGCWTAQI
jgi:hypothetical protein